MVLRTRFFESHPCLGRVHIVRNLCVQPNGWKEWNQPVLSRNAIEDRLRYGHMPRVPRIAGNVGLSWKRCKKASVERGNRGLIALLAASGGTESGAATSFARALTTEILARCSVRGDQTSCG